MGEFVRGSGCVGGGFGVWFVAEKGDLFEHFRGHFGELERGVKGVSLWRGNGGEAEGCDMGVP